MILETVIIGAGIGGLSAGIYAARKRMKYAIISKDTCGQMYESGEILNYPGIVKTTGSEFAEIFAKEIEFNKLNIIQEEVATIRKLKNGLWLVQTGKEKYESKTVILALGSHPRKLNIPGEDRLAKKGVTYCAICDGPLFVDKEVAIVGGGDSALEAVDFMARIAKKIYLITENPEMRGHEYLLERITNLKNVEVLPNTKTKEIVGDSFVSGVKYLQGKEEGLLNVQAVIVEIGRIPNTDFLKDIVDLDEHKHIKVDRWARCYVNNEIDDTAYAIGDCSDVHEYQYVISAGMGVTALLKAVRYLAKRD